MCLTLPFKIKKIFKGRAELTDGRKVKIDLAPNLKSGDWVLVNADLALKKISASEAAEINNYFKL